MERKNDAKTPRYQLEAAARYIKANRDRFTMSAPKGRRAIWEEAAARRGLSLNAWSISTLDAAASQILQDQETGTRNASPAEEQTENQDQTPARQP